MKTEDRKKVPSDLSLEDRLDSVGQLAIGMAHDFNNLLTVIGSNLELAAPHVTHAEASVMIADTLKAVEEGANLSQRLMAYVGKQKLYPDKLSMGICLLKSVRLIERTLGEDILITTKLDPHAWSVFVDPIEIQSALINLAVNARDAMPNGGSLTMELRNSVLSAEDIELNADIKPGEYVEIIVSDTGTGMTTDVMQNALEPFYTTKKRGQGTGLGLSSVNEFVEDSGGFLKLYSHVDRGTTVRLYLPRACGQNAPEDADRATESA